MKNMISFIHCADLHLDAPFTGTGTGSFSKERRGDLKETFEKIISLVSESNADYLLISGDLYEHHYVTGSTISWLNVQFGKIGDKPCILVPGNHDPYVANSWYKSFRWNPNVHILTTKSPCYLDEQNGVYFYGIGFDTFRQECLPLTEPPHVEPDRINLCLFHGTVDMTFTENAYNPVSSKALSDMGFDYYAAGHFHGRNENLAAQGIVNAGSPEPLGFDETGVHGVYRVILEKKEGHLRREIQFIPVQKRFYRVLELDITGAESVLKFQKNLIELLTRVDMKKDIVRVNINGRMAAGCNPGLSEAEPNPGEMCYHLELCDHTRPDYNLEELAAESNITGVFVRMMLDRIRKSTEEEKKLLEKSLYLGLDAIFRGSVELS
jgi:DNA repair exonuclease SbcCD nuclease subunit